MSQLGQIVSLARAELGTPYRWSGYEPGGFDCSGLVYWIYNKVGITSVPRTADLQQRWAIPVQDPQPGDLVFFDPGPAGVGGRSIQGGAGHVGIYIGNGMMIDATHPGSDVQIGPVQNNGLTFMGYGRPPGVAGSAPDATLTSIPGDIGKAVTNPLGLDLSGIVAPLTKIAGVFSLAQLGIPGFIHRLGLTLAGIFCIGMGIVIIVADLAARVVSRSPTIRKGLRGTSVPGGVLE